MKRTDFDVFLKFRLGFEACSNWFKFTRALLHNLFHFSFSSIWIDHSNGFIMFFNLGNSHHCDRIIVKIGAVIELIRKVKTPILSLSELSTSIVRAVCSNKAANNGWVWFSLFFHKTLWVYLRWQINSLYCCSRYRC